MVARNGRWQVHCLYGRFFLVLVVQITLRARRKLSNGVLALQIGLPLGIPQKNV
jgi:hypothetical protein